MDLRFLRAMESGRAAGDRFWTALIRDDLNKPVAAAFISLLTLDLAMMAGGTVKKIVDQLRTIAPGALKYQAIVCGLPISAGQSHLHIAPGADIDAVVQSLLGEMESLAKPIGARFLILKEFDQHTPQVHQSLKTNGCFMAESPPMNLFPTNFTSFEDYLSALKAPYRSKIVRSQRKFAERGLRVETITQNGPAVAERFTDAAHQMYLNVVDRSSIKLEVLSREWFCSMANQFPNESVWLAVYEGDQLLAWAYGLLHGNAYHSLFGGVDYDRNSETDAYFNLTYHELDFALRSGVQEIHLGQTADDFKSRLGAVQNNRWFFLKPLRWKARVVLNLAADRVLPTFPPAPPRHVFHAKTQLTPHS